MNAVPQPIDMSPAMIQSVGCVNNTITDAMKRRPVMMAANFMIASTLVTCSRSVVQRSPVSDERASDDQGSAQCDRGADHSRNDSYCR